VVIAILGILASVLVPSIGDYVTKAKEAKIDNSLSEAMNACVTLLTNMATIENYNFSEKEDAEVVEYMIGRLQEENNLSLGNVSPFPGSTEEKIYLNYIYNEYTITLDYYKGVDVVDTYSKTFQSLLEGA
jgi:type II secretory pathway pseudopilin PulG